MYFDIKKELKLKKIHYSVLQKNSYKGQANITLGVLLRRIVVSNLITGHTYKLKQNNIFYKLLYICVGCWLPIDLFPEYRLYSNNKYIGKTKVSFCTPKRILRIGNDIYELCIHSNNYISIMKNNIQIALVQREKSIHMEQSKYHVVYDEKLENNMELLFLLIIFIDIIYFPQGNKINYFKYETTAGNDKYFSRTSWTPFEKY